MMKINKRNLLVVVLSIMVSIISGILTRDLIIGGSILLTSLLCPYYQSIGKKSSFIIGLINCLLMAYACFKNNLYGTFLLCILFVAPSQIIGFINWNRNQDEDKNVKVRDFTFKNSIIIIFSCIIGSFVLGYLLSLIPSQNLAFMDASSNCINICATILMVLRFKESWWVFIFNNIIDLAIWIIMTINHGSGSWMVLLSSLAYFLINVYGIIKWSIEAKKNKISKE